MGQKGKTEKEKNQHIHVAVRCRPLNSSEHRHGSYSVVESCPDRREINVRERATPTAPVKTFTFDRVFGTASKQIEVYKSVVSPIIDEVVQGYNCTVFAYGQTGTGKTFTMEGERTENTDVSWEEDPLAGIIPRAMHNLFARLQKQNCEFSVRVSYLEIYNEELIDLLGAESNDNPRLKIYEDTTRKGSCVIQGLEEVVVHDKSEVYGIMERGSQRRQTAATLMNAHSSRSHSLFMVTVHIKENSMDGEELLKTGKINLVDLAGSECIGRSGAVDKRAREAGQINQSLLTLGRVITALVEHAPHVPYRESKLTRLLQDSLGGRTKTSIIATISPAACNLEETLSTLDYAYRAKNITNRPEINQKLTKKALLREYTEEIERLRRDLQASRDKNGIYLATENYEALTTQILQQKDQLSTMEEKMEAINMDLIKISELFGITKEELMSTQNELKEATTDLENTRTSLRKTETSLRHTRQDRDEQKHLVTHHVKTENMLHAQATQLLHTAETSTSDVEGLHAKLGRKHAVEVHNEEVQESFQHLYHDSIATMKTSLNGFTEGQLEFNTALATNMGHLLENRAKELSEVRGDLSSLVSQVCQQGAAGQREQEAVMAAAETQLQDISSFCADTETTEVKRQATFHEGTFVASVSLIQEMLERHNTALEQLATLLKQQLSDQQSAWQSFAARQMEQYDEQRTLVETYCAAEVLRVQAHTEHTQKMKMAHDTLRQTLVDDLLTNMGQLVRQMADKEKEHHHTQCNQLLSTLGETQKCTDEFKASALSRVSSMASDQEKSSEEFLTQSTSHNQKAAANIQELQSEVTTVTEKSTSLKTEVTTFTELTQKNLSSHMREVQQRIRSHGQHLRQSVQQHEQSLEVLMGDCKHHGDALQQKQDSHQKHLQGTVQSEKNSLEENSKSIADWSTTLCTSLENSAAAVDHFLTEDLTKDMPTGNTPKPRNFSYPRTLSRTGRHGMLLEDFRKDYVMNEALNTPVPDDSFESLMSQAAAEADQSSDLDGGNVGSEHSNSFDSAISSSSLVSSNTDSLPQENKENLTVMPPPRAPSVKSTTSTNRSRSNSRTRNTSQNKTPAKTPTKTPGKTKTTAAPSSKPSGSSASRSRLPLKMSN